MLEFPLKKSHNFTKPKSFPYFHFSLDFFQFSRYYWVHMTPTTSTKYFHFSKFDTADFKITSSPNNVRVNLTTRFIITVR